MPVPPRWRIGDLARRTRSPRPATVCRCGHRAPDDGGRVRGGGPRRQGAAARSRARTPGDQVAVGVPGQFSSTAIRCRARPRRVEHHRLAMGASRQWGLRTPCRCVRRCRGPARPRGQAGRGGAGELPARRSLESSTAPNRSASAPPTVVLPCREVPDQREPHGPGFEVPQAGSAALRRPVAAEASPCLRRGTRPWPGRGAEKAAGDGGYRASPENST
jgi:hypothetical protein